MFIGLYEQDTYYEVDSTGSVNANAGSINFLPAIVKGYSDLPVALNLVIFGTLIITLTWVIVTSVIPTLDGGS